MTTIRKLFDRAYAAARERSYVRGLLGRPNGDGTYTIPSAVRDNMWYVRVSQEGRQSVTLAKSLGNVPARANLPVRMLFENGQWVIQDVDPFYFSEATSGDATNNFGVPAHTHAIGSNLEYEIEPMRVGVGLVRPAGGWVVSVGAFRYLSGSTWETYPGATVSLLANRPGTSGKHRLAIVTVDPSTNLASVVNGSEEDYATALDQTSIDAISIGTKIPLAAVRIRNDDTTINVQSRFIDARGWLNLGGAGALNDLSDVVITSPTNGEMLYYNSVTGWYNDDPPFVPVNLEDLLDVSFTTLTDGDWLRYDSGGNEWVNDTIQLDDLTDVNLGTPTGGQVLAYDDGPGEWVPANPSSGALDDLSDVTITAPSDGEVLTYDSGSGEWINAAPTGGGGGGALDDLSDVTITTPSSGDTLRYNGSGWVNAHVGRTIITDWSFRDGTGLSTSSFTWKGNRFTPDVDVDLYAICYFGTIVANGVYQAAVITGTGTPGNIATATKSASHTVGASPASLLGAHIWLEFSSPVRLTAGTQYGLMVGRTDGAGTYQLPVPFTGGTGAHNAVPMPGLSHGAGWRVADASLTVGSAIDQATGNSMAQGFRFRFPNSVY